MKPPASPLRLRRLLDPATGRGLLLSFTAGMEVGVAPGTADLPTMVGSLAQGRQLTGAVVRAGAMRSLFGGSPNLPFGVVVDLLGGTWLTPQMDRPSQICSLEHAVRAGADGVLVTISLGGCDESSRLRLCGQIARDAANWGVPLIVRIDTMALSGPRQYSAVLSGQGARMAYELGADLAVVNYSGSQETFADALRGIDIPVLIGGGPDMATDEALLDSVDQALGCGAAGAMLSGPMFWQDDRPTPALDRLAAVIFGCTKQAAAAEPGPSRARFSPQGEDRQPLAAGPAKPFQAEAKLSTV